MLKLTYVENSFYLESLTEPLEVLLNNRTLLALRSGHSLWLEKTTAAFSVANQLTELTDLLNLIQEQPENDLMLFPCDVDRIEINLTGFWLSSHPNSAEGIFFPTVSDRIESIIYHLWEMSQVSAPVQ